MLVYFKKNWETFGRLFGSAGEVEHAPKLWLVRHDNSFN